jgi:NAD(P)-dependent dehydrogenase (short-subunit alcohol dehydrogenase family)
MNPQDFFSLAGKVAIVTGASKGIGEAIARAYAHYGASVIVSSRKQDAVQAVADSITQSSGTALALAANASSSADLKALVDKAVEVYGRVDIVVNNAAANPTYGPIHATDEAVFDKIMAVNVKGPFELAKHAYPHLTKQGGAVINISSIGGITPEDGLGIYSVSKAALIMLTKATAKEWGANNIRVNAICPGLIKTKFSQALWDNEQMMKSYMRHLPLHRIGSPEEVAALALFLASEAGSFCTGAVYAVDGGHTI